MDHLKLAEQKTFTERTAFANHLHRWRFQGHTIVFTNGCFDILHKGHIHLLAQAAAQGHRLIIGLNTDASVKRLKGPTRPANQEADRALVLASLHMVNAVILFDEDTPYELIQFLQPDVLVKGADYEVKDIVGADVVQANGGRVVRVELVEGYSTTRLLGE